MKELYIHVGQAKTGTSMIQAFLALNRKLLHTKGLYYPLFREEVVVRDKNCGMGGNAYGMWELDRPLDQMNKAQIEYMQQIKAWFKDNDKVLISEEGLWVCSAAFYQNFSSLLDDGADFRVRIVVYLRRQDERLESLWNQCVKAGTYHHGCMEFCDEYIGADQDYYSQLEMIAGIIGKENMIVKIYDDRYSVGNYLLEDFMSIFGYKDISEFRIPKFQVNPSLGKDLIEMVRVTSTIRDIRMIDDEFRKIKKELTEFRESTETVAHAPSFLTYEERKRILDRCDQGNQKIGREYFGIDKSPFSELKQDYKKASGGGGISKELVYFLFSLIVEQAKEIEMLHWNTDDFKLSENL